MGVGVGRGGAALLALAVGLVTASRAARGYVRFQNAGHPVYWKQTCVPVTIYTNGFESVMPLESIAKSIAAAAHAWSSDAVSCSPDGKTHPYLEIVPTIIPGEGMAVAGPNDARNTIVFLRTSWGAGDSYATNGLALTHVWSSPDGHILDADIEINAVPTDVHWANLDPGVVASSPHVETDVEDLQNTMTHEFGHLIGLDHSCFRPVRAGADLDARGNPRPTDDQGKPAPDCGDPTASLAEVSVMYDSVEPQQTSKRTLSDEDVRAVCEMYAPSLAHDPCALDQPVAGCAVTPTRLNPGGWGLGIATTATVMLGLAWKRRARRTRRRHLRDSGRARA